MPGTISELGLLLAVALLVLAVASLVSVPFLLFLAATRKIRQASRRQHGPLLLLLLLLLALLCGLVVVRAAHDHLRPVGAALSPLARRLAGGLQQGGGLQRVDEIALGALLGLILTLWFGMLLRGRTGGPDDAGFRLTTFSAAFLFCAAVVLPYVDRWMTHASDVGVEGWGFTLKLSMQQPDANRGSDAVFGPQGGAVDRAAALSGPVTALDAVIGIA